MVGVAFKTEPILHRGDHVRVEVEEGGPAQVVVKLPHSTDEHIEIGLFITDRDVLVAVLKHNCFHFD